MAKLSLTQNNFSAGELSPLFSARMDSELYGQGADTMENYVPIVQGPVMRRPGNEFIWEVYDSNGYARLIPFRFSTTQAYILEFGHLYIRFYKDGGPILETATNITGATQANPIVITSVAHGYSNGNEIFIESVAGMTEINNRRFIVANVAANTYELYGINGTGYSAYTSGGTAERIYTVTSTFSESELDGIGFCQSADRLYLDHVNHPPATLTRTGHTSWTLSHGTTLGLYPSSFSGPTITVTVSAGPIYTYTFTASSALFTDLTSANSHRQSIVWKDGGGTWREMALILSSSTVATSYGTKYLYSLVTNSEDYRLSIPVLTSFPKAPFFHEDRLVHIGMTNYPQRIDASETSNYGVFAWNNGATVVDSDGIAVSVQSSEVNNSIWGVSDERGMFVGTSGAEFVIRASSQGDALSPLSVSAKKISTHGSKDVQPIQVGKATLFIQSAGRKLRELFYQYSSDGHVADDLTRAAEHITIGGIDGLAYMKEPYPIVWAVRGDGTLLSMTYERMGDAVKVGWARHIIGGVSDASGNQAEVESIAVIPNQAGDADELWMIVLRRINGVAKRYVERMTKFFEESDDQEDAFFVDSGLTYQSDGKVISAATQANPVVLTSASHGYSNGDRIRISLVEGMTELNGNAYTVANVTANTWELSGIDGTSYGAYIIGGYARKMVTAISGLDHLEGQTVKIFADGAPQADKTVASGAITLSSAAATATIGLGYTSKLKLLRPAAQSAIGSSHGKMRRIIEVTLDLYRTLGMKIGKSFDSLNTVHFRTTGVAMGQAPALFSGFKKEPINFDTDQDNQLCIQQDQPTPGTIRAVSFDVKAE